MAPLVPDSSVRVASVAADFLFGHRVAEPLVAGS